ncbi:hypothetical protein G5V57_24210 [Nordella sp. HKS 07]|uniref:hypothetical protein n=1 Tax=Nordella sp. HKS 07 TaxID=2712222 RepID=UPI0013E2009A|nr:hypothetical protein [Nordella sp. HKS 07]QIG50558.1 hypothetical protein G5V57_24210 [Nordella sp. HKS 07]
MMLRRSAGDFGVVVLSAVLIGTGAVSATAQSVTIGGGYITGNEYQQLREAEKIVYAAGLVDGMLGAPLFGAPDSGRVARLDACIKNKSAEQIAAILSKDLQENPELWHLGVNVPAYNALNKVCDLKD